MIISKKTIMGPLLPLLLGDSALRYVSKDVLIKFYFSVILPSINYDLILWGSCCNSELINSIDRLHCRAAKIIFNLSKDVASSEVMKTVNWSIIRLSYMYNAYKNILPDSLCGKIFSKRENYYSLRGHEVAAIRKHKSRFMKTH